MVDEDDVCRRFMDCAMKDLLKWAEDIDYGTMESVSARIGESQAPRKRSLWMTMETEAGMVDIQVTLRVKGIAPTKETF